MKFIPLFASVVVLVWAAGATLRAERLPWIVPGYVIAQGAFALVGFLGLQKDILFTRGYFVFFSVAFGAVLVGAMWFAAQQGAGAPEMGWAVLPWTLGHFAFLGWVLHRILGSVYGSVPAQLKMAIFQGAVLLACGTVALLSTVLRLSPELHVAAVGLGVFWVAMGVMAWGWSVGAMRNFGVWLTLNSFVPAMIAVVAFGWIALELGKMQGEGARESVPSQVEMAVTR